MNIPEIFQTMSYGPAQEQSDYVYEWLEGHKDGFKLFIDGKWVKAKSSDKQIESRNPATGEPLAKLTAAGADDVDRAVKAAAKAFPQWSKQSGHERAKYLYSLARLLQKTSRFMSVLETLDNGKPIRESRDIDIPLVARHFYHHAGWAQIMDQELPDQEPLGVIGQIIPWNFPLLMLAWKIAPALAAGNCIVLKPAEYTSLTALYFAELCEEAGLPPGVVNIVTGAGDTGAHIVNHPDIAKIAFTGSTNVGRGIRQATAGSGKKLTLELGGKSPFIVFEDADIDGAVEGLVDAIWFNQGEVCCAGSRLLVEEGIGDRLIKKIKTRLGKFRVGDPLDKTIDMGAIVDPVQLERITALVNKGAEEGAEVWQPDISCPVEGCFYPPTLITNVSPSNIVVREEIFGPVLTVMTFRTLKEAADLANNTRFGLAASVWSENINRALEVSAMIKAGVVWVNSTNQFDAACGFGGYRESGFGREGGKEGMYEYLKPRGEWLSDKGNLIKNPKATGQILTGTNSTGLAIDRTAKNYIGGKQARPDGGNTRIVLTHDGAIADRVGDGNRKDIRNAVEAAFKNPGWSSATAHNRAQVIYYIAENLSARENEVIARLESLTGVSKKAARAEFDMAVSRLFSAAAWADKFDGMVHTPPSRNVTLAINEPIGIMGIVCPDIMPLLSFISLVAPAIAMGNRTVVIPSERYPLLATDFYQILETSDVPAGVINIVTGDRDELSKTLADHDQLDAIWYHGSRSGSQMVERLSAANLKRTWVNDGRARDWMSAHGEGRRFLREATEVKNIWLPYGD
ncbi:MAG: aldehyde dehydrogenase family protein [Emcibacter sp.]|nr:aldehyde dehydrogenase family protein [Emcibacter sp.]